MSYTGKLKTQLYWWLTKHRPFVINDEYAIELLFVDREKLVAKILVTNLKTNQIIEQDLSASEV